MAKKIIANIKLQLKAGKATPSPPVGPALGQHGVNIMEFCKAYNAMTQNQEGTVIPVVITVYADRSFTFITKTPPTSVLLKQAAKIAKGANNPKKERVATLTTKHIRDIAELKYNDLNAIDMDGAIRIIEGTARSMGIEIIG